MAKLHNLATILTVSSILGLFFAAGAPLSANAAPSHSIVIKAADSDSSDDSDSDDDDDSDEDVEITRPKNPKFNERTAVEKKRHELREKFGSKDSLGLPPIVIHPEDDSDDDSGEADDDAASTKLPRKKKPALTPVPSPSPSASVAVTTDPSVIASTSSLKGGSIVPNPAAVQGTTQNSKLPQGTSNSISKEQLGQTAGAGTLKPNEAAPIEIEKAEISRRSDADKFIEAATTSLAAMGIGAIALGAITVVRGKRQLKEQVAEYQYNAGE
jgi:hypothetical protein